MMAWVSDVTIARTIKVKTMATIKTLKRIMKNFVTNTTNATLKPC